VDRSPYAYIKSPNANGKEGEVSNGNGGGEGEPWHWHTKQRKMMKAEISDAFRIRNWVVVVLVLGMLGGVVVSGMVVRQAVSVWRHWREF
jgi:hypothetical protein